MTNPPAGSAFRSCTWLVATWVVAVGCSTPPAGAGDASSTSSGGEGGHGGGTTTTSVATTSAVTTSAATTTSSATGSGGHGGGQGGSGGAARDPNCPPAVAGVLPPLALTQVATGLQFPVFVAGAPGDSTRLYVLERAGRVRIIKDGVLLAQPFLDITALCQNPKPLDSRGLLGLAFHPDFAQNGRFFLHYMPATDGHSTLVEYARSSDPDLAVATPTQTLLVMDDLQTEGHNGGMVAFGKDGMLYATFGDGGGQEDPLENGQNIQSKLGKMLRFDVDNHPLPPPGNLPGANAYVWDYGLRNPWRFSFDRCTGDLYIADVGQYLWEEINVEPAGQGNKNYGWDEMEGGQCFEPPVSCDLTGILPTLQYDHNEGCSITGGYVYRGTKIPELVGSYLYGDWCENRVWAFAWQDGSITMAPIELTADLQSVALMSVGLSSFGEDADGELYLVDLGGTIYRLDPE